MRMIVASVLSHLVVRPRRFWKIKEKKKKKKINNDLAIVASRYLKGRFMTLTSTLYTATTEGRKQSDLTPILYTITTES